ncbi:MAG: redoxin domain-containing protein [Myxococcales bacterium]|nr:redoxin domain-containing protein [Myxococcales bacterium]
MSLARRSFHHALLGLALAGALPGCKLVPRAPGPPPGEPAPDFTLPSHDGQTVSLAGLRKLGPAVVVFYRGFW